MRKEARSIPAAFRGVVLPHSAHESLVRTRDQLRLLAQLTEPRGDAPETVFVSPDALAELFDRVAHHLDDALSVVVDDGAEPT
ncbi:XAC0095 family protein [Lysobacter panacisoli]|uniref:XAC0095-like domain-containing protein n=1 Tax=Lysobacter panacisoli TaxID=1255263 RepID=A0ABP9LQZ8_9GAMM|nr:hypothetical protein [Lysobacter panacisoli]